MEHFGTHFDHFDASNGKTFGKWVILTLDSFSSFHPNSQIGTDLNRNIYSANLNEIPVAG